MHFYHPVWTAIWLYLAMYELLSDCICPCLNCNLAVPVFGRVWAATSDCICSCLNCYLTLFFPVWTAIWLYLPMSELLYLTVHIFPCLNWNLTVFGCVWAAIWLYLFLSELQSGFNWPCLSCYLTTYLFLSELQFDCIWPRLSCYLTSYLFWSELQSDCIWPCLNWCLECSGPAGTGKTETCKDLAKVSLIISLPMYTLPNFYFIPTTVHTYILDTYMNNFSN